MEDTNAFWDTKTATALSTIKSAEYTYLNTDTQLITWNISMLQQQMVPSDILGQNDFLIPLDSSQRGASDGINVTCVAVACERW